MTASSFAAVSLEPPLILVNLEKRSETLALVRAVGSFAVNVLASDQEDLARSFAASGVKSFSSIDYRNGSDGHPLIEGCIAWMECRTREITDGGDHEVVIGEVAATGSADGPPLIYWDRRYRSLHDG